MSLCSLPEPTQTEAFVCVLYECRNVCVFFTYTFMCVCVCVHMSTLTSPRISADRSVCVRVVYMPEYVCFFLNIHIYACVCVRVV